MFDFLDAQFPAWRAWASATLVASGILALAHACGLEREIISPNAAPPPAITADH